MRVILERMARDDDRSLSKFVARLIEAEAQRRKLLPTKERG
jgi:hypothetical protein